MGFYLSSVTPSNYVNVTNPVRLQQYLPPAVEAERSFSSFGAYNTKTKVYTTVAAGYPSADTLTLWTSSISGTDALSVSCHVVFSFSGMLMWFLYQMKATPILNGVKVQFPVSSAPAPLNYLPLKVAKVVTGPNDGILAIFTNGEVHSLDVDSGKLTLLHKLIPDDKALDVSHPWTAGAHIFDLEKNGLWSVVSAGMYSYLIFTDYKTFQSTEWLKLDAGIKCDPGVDSTSEDFSPETFVNAMLIDTGNGQGTRLMLQLESLDSIGFDMLTWVDTTTGKFTGEGPMENLMGDNIVLRCLTPYDCDKNRQSTYDPTTKTVWFQGHLVGGSNDGSLAINGLGFDTSKQGKETFYIWTPNPMSENGHSNFQFYTF